MARCGSSRTKKPQNLSRSDCRGETTMGQMTQATIAAWQEKAGLEPAADQEDQNIRRGIRADQDHRAGEIGYPRRRRVLARRGRDWRHRLADARIARPVDACRTLFSWAILFFAHPEMTMMRYSSSASWRKCLLLNRSALLSAWARYFPRHDFATLHLIRSSPDPIIPWPNEEAWSRAARAYHEERKRSMRR
jgi:hypothetical protein